MTGRNHRTKIGLLALGAGVCAIGAGIRVALRKPSKRLAGRVALITGGSRGLGLALASKLQDAGCRLALVARSLTELEEAKSRLQSRNSAADVEVFAYDITMPDAPEEMVAAVIARFGHLDILVNNAGLIEVAPLEALQLEDFRRAMDLMFFAHLKSMFAAVPHMTARGEGHIVNISSIGGRVSMPRLLPYSCAKFALTGLSEGLAVELRRQNVHVLTVIPGLMRTGSHVQAEFKGQARKEYRWFALGATSPFVAVSASSAASRIVNALRNREHECVISMPAKLLSLIHGVAPGLTGSALAVADQLLLPKPSRSQTVLTGQQCDEDAGPVFRTLTGLGPAAAKEWNETGPTG